MSKPVKLEIPENSPDFRSRLYTGISFGSSRLSPDTSGTVFNVDSDSDVGSQLRLGYDLHNMLAVELDTSVLGASELREANTDVKYSSAAISALVYGLGGVQMRSRREGLSVFGRFGYGSLKKSSAVVDLEDSGAVPIVGIGAEYGFNNGLGIRAEMTRFDSDASFIGFGAIYRFGISPAGIGKLVASAAEPALGAAHSTVASDGRTISGDANGRFNGQAAIMQGSSASSVQHYAPVQQPQVRSVADRWRPAMRPDDQDADGVLDEADQCASTARHVTVDRSGCGLFDSVLEDVTFKSGSRWLSPLARGQLDRVAETLLAFPEARVQVRAHTDSQGPADMNLALSSRRAEAVVQYLQSRGVNELQLHAVGVGEAQPLDTNGTNNGRKRNRRVDVVTLPDLDAGRLLMAEGRGSARVVSVADPSQIQPDEEGYRVATGKAAEQWNSAMDTASETKQPTPSSEPSLQAAKPVQRSAAEGTARPMNRLPLPVNPLPQPGIVPGLGIAGVVEGLGFNPGEATLRADAQQALKPVIEGLNKYPSVAVAVMAHTDNQGAPEDNLALSRQRARAVVEHLVQAGISQRRLKAEGYGELLPVVQNVTEEDRARNRRVEIRIER